MTLRNMYHSFEHYLNENKYYTPDQRVSKMTDVLFEDANLVLQNKRRVFLKQGLGNKPNRSIPVDESEEALLW